IGSGAFAGSIPYRSDRIFKKQANYENNVPWGNSIPENMQRGVWLCAWLSGNMNDPTQTPVWMDRWYDPGTLDSTYTLFVCSNSAVYDAPSILSFDPGVWYRYDHMGDKFNLQIVNSLCCMKLHLDDWGDDILIDSSGYGNNSYIQKYTSTCKSV
ncbi:MAG: hypothetical protein WC905_05235, partial [Patescibacteria group bacterium]